jgi:tRNA 2-thiouridine synthesizing protein C
MKKILFIMHSKPHAGVDVQEKLDVILTTAAFDQQVALLFLDEGIFQIYNNQCPENQGLKDTASIINTLELFDVTEFYIETESLQERGLKTTRLSLPVELCNRKHINKLIQQFDLVISG